MVVLTQGLPLFGLQLYAYNGKIIIANLPTLSSPMHLFYRFPCKKFASLSWISWKNRFDRGLRISYNQVNAGYIGVFILFWVNSS